MRLKKRAADLPQLQGLPPVVAANTRLVVLGSFPGVTSLQARQYYGHPHNHFWPLMGAMWGVDLMAQPYEWRVQTLLDHGVGLWDVYASCRRQGSLDAAIHDVQVNDLNQLRLLAPGLLAVAHNGGESARAGQRTGQTAALGLAVHHLPSTSRANASWSFERKRQAWALALASAGFDVSISG